MTDIKELFDMVETKNEPDLDSWNNRKIVNGEPSATARWGRW